MYLNEASVPDMEEMNDAALQSGALVDEQHEPRTNPNPVHGNCAAEQFIKSSLKLIFEVIISKDNKTSKRKH